MSIGDGIAWAAFWLAAAWVLAAILVAHGQTDDDD
jgi:hypothetical protein